MTRLSSDILLPFPNSNDLNSREGQKTAQNDIKNSVPLTLYCRNCASYDCDFWFLEGKRAKNDPILPILVCLNFISQELLYIISSRFLVCRCKIVISPGVFLYFFNTTYENYVNIKNSYIFFIGPLQQS